MFGENRKKSKIDTLLKEIRGEYQTLIENFSRPESIRKQFELRYHDAVEYRLDLLRFLEAEKEAVKALLERAESRAAEKKEGPAAKTPPKASKPPDKNGGEQRISFADKLIKEFAERIEKYPEILIHPDAAFEIKKLFGALSCIEKDYWGVVDRILRNQIGSKRFRDSIDIEPEISRMCSAGLDGLPPALGTYYGLLERQNRDYEEIEREEKRCLMKAAGLLKKLQMEIIRALDTDAAVEEEDKILLVDAKNYIEAMMNDFRLKDLAKLS